ncbi:MAG: hypothetical protein ABJE47_10495 [bacterium]
MTDVGLAMGATLPRGEGIGALDLAGGPKAGFTISGSVGIRPFNSSMSFRLEAQYARLGLDDSPRIELGGDAPVIAKGSAAVLSGTGNVVLALISAGRVRPYFIGGIGVYQLSSDIGYVTPSGHVIENSAPSPSETKFGVNGGVGFEVSVVSLRTFVEARIHSVYADGNRARLIPITFGMKF